MAVIWNWLRGPDRMAFTFTGCKTESGVLFKGLYEVQPVMHSDSRGFFLETYNERDFTDAGLTMKFVQDNVSESSRGVLRGLHFQKAHPQGKLVGVLSGRVFDVAVDLRKESATFGRWYGVILDAAKKNMLYIPEGFAHGYLVLSDTALFAYKCTDFYDPESEGGIAWNDPTIGIDWPVVQGMDPVLNERDKMHPLFDAECGYFSSVGVWIGK